jgi:trk system potassium uptake protein TrkA
LAKNIADAGGVVVLGLGRFGKSLALELERDGVEVLGIERDAKRVQDLAGRLTHVVQADSTDIEAMRQLSVGEFGRAVIGIGNDLEASVLTAFVLRSLGLRNIWAKAVSESQGKILEQVGVPHVVRPEHDMGRRVAHLVRGTMLDYIEFDDGYAIVKTTPPRSILGKTLAEAGVRSAHGVTIVGIKTRGQDFTYAVPESVAHEGDLLIVSGDRAKVERFSNLD